MAATYDRWIHHGEPLHAEPRADDSLIFLKKNLNNAISLQQVLDTYCASSGQLVSVDKSSIFFSPNTNVEVKVEICNTLNINTESLSDK
jgi:hypothetical protein